MEYFKSNKRETIIPSCILDLDSIKKLYEILQILNEEAISIEIAKIETEIKSLNKNYTDEEKQAFFKKIKEMYAVYIQINGANGEYIETYDKNTLEDKHLPDRIKYFSFNNTIGFKGQNNIKQTCQFIVDFDFTKSDLVDFLQNPSKRTINDSLIGVYGLNESWVEGAHEKIFSFLKERKSNREWLHRKNVYDFLLWFLFLPMTFWFLYKFDLWFSKQQINSSNIFYSFVYVYLIFFSMFLFSFIFKYSRWLFSYLEYKTNLKALYKVQRGFLITVIIGLVITWLTEFINLIIRILL